MFIWKVIQYLINNNKRIHSVFHVFTTVNLLLPHPVFQTKSIQLLASWTTVTSSAFIGAKAHTLLCISLFHKTPLSAFPQVLLILSLCGLLQEGSSSFLKLREPHPVGLGSFSFMMPLISHCLFFFKLLLKIVESNEQTELTSKTETDS